MYILFVKTVNEFWPMQTHKKKYIKLIINTKNELIIYKYLLFYNAIYVLKLYYITCKIRIHTITIIKLDI